MICGVVVRPSYREKCTLCTGAGGNCVDVLACRVSAVQIVAGSALRKQPLRKVLDAVQNIKTAVNQHASFDYQAFVAALYIKTLSVVALIRLTVFLFFLSVVSETSLSFTCSVVSQTSASLSIGLPALQSYRVCSPSSDFREPPVYACDAPPGTDLAVLASAVSTPTALAPAAL